jgi:carbamoyltransferase
VQESANGRESNVRRSYIGLANTYHDGAIAIVNPSGELVFAEATERYLQFKRAVNVSADLPHYSAKLLRSYCEPADEIVAAFSWTDRIQDTADQHRKGYEDAEASLKTLFGETPAFLRRDLAYGRFALASQLRASAMCGQTLGMELSRMPGWETTPVISRRYDHHLTHAASACFTSPFEEAVCAVVDGFGEERAFACFRYRGGRLEEIEPVASQARGSSLGLFYQTVCEACGFDYVSGEEWKVMGLAAYGRHDAILYDIFHELIRVNDLAFETCAERREFVMRRELHELSRKQSDPALAAANLAFTGQEVFTEVLMEFLGNLHRRGISGNLVLGGGCALNSSATGQVLGQVPFKNVHVFCAPADDGNAVGAALLAFQQDHPDYRPPGRIQSPYLGSRMDGETSGNLRRFGGFPKMTECAGRAPQLAAQLLANGKIVGWIQGRAEFGPRALGNRSILADPRSASVKEEINRRVKFREEFRPFAPSILHEFGSLYFENYQESPYMERTLRFRAEAAAEVPGVVHMDGTGRLQTVRREWNAPYYDLIRHFYELTGIPLVLNTSFNVMGKPISHSVEDAMAVFCTSGLDAIFIDDLLIEK